MGPAADVYALGGVLWRLLTGKTLYPGRNLVMTIYAHANEPIPELEKDVPAAPRRLCELIQRMVAKKASDRPGSREVIETLDAILSEVRGDEVHHGGGRIDVHEPPPSSVPQTVVKGGHELAVAVRPAGERMEVKMNGIVVPFRWCPAGTFVMGSPKGEVGRSGDEDQVEVTLTKGFWMAETETTQQLYESVMGTNPAHFKGASKPVERVSWEGATEFCTRLTARERSAGRLSGTGVYRLPTEAEWEYACRAGTRTATAFGDTLSSRQANFDGDFPYNGAEKGPYLGETCEVGQYPANGWGLQDMHGNVWEWCQDAYAAELKGGADPVMDISADGGAKRVLRGGSWSGLGLFCRSSYRNWSAPGGRDDIFGFRCLRTE